MGYINRSQKQECRNWDCGRAVPFLGIFVLNYWYCVFLQCVDKDRRLQSESQFKETESRDHLLVICLLISGLVNKGGRHDLLSSIN